jgi:hypothetical protein
MIVPVEVDRDARGYWTHPALIRVAARPRHS